MKWFRAKRVSEFESELLEYLSCGDASVYTLADSCAGGTTTAHRWRVFLALLSLEKRGLTRLYRVSKPGVSNPTYKWTLT